MSEMKVNMLDEDEIESLRLAIATGMGDVPDEQLNLVLTKAIDWMHEAKVKEAMLGLLLDGLICIRGLSAEDKLIFAANDHRPTGH